MRTTKQEVQWESYDFNLVFEDFKGYLKVKTQMKKLAKAKLLLLLSLDPWENDLESLQQVIFIRLPYI